MKIEKPTAIVAGVAFILGVGITAGTEAVVNSGQPHGTIIKTDDYSLKSGDAFNFLVKNPNNQQSLLGYTINKALLAKYPDSDKFVKQAKEKLDQVIKQFGGKARFDSALSAKNSNEEEYLLSIENVLIIKDQIKKSYNPTSSEIENAYKTLGNKMNVSGVIVTPTNSSDKKSVAAAKSAADAMAGKGFNAQKMLKSTKLYTVTGINGMDGVSITGVNGNNNGNIPANVLSKLKNKSAGSVVTADSSYGHYVVKVDKVVKKGSLSAEKAGIVSALKESAASDSTKQLHFSAKLLKDDNFKSDNAGIQKMIDLTKTK